MRELNTIITLLKEYSLKVLADAADAESFKDDILTHLEEKNSLFSEYISGHLSHDGDFKESDKFLNIPYGSCVSWRVPPSQNSFLEKIFGYLQNFFTRAPETHSSIIMSAYPEIDAYYEFEQSVTARINIYSSNPNSTIYDILAEKSIKVHALETLRIENYGKIYGIFQTLVFAVRWFLEVTHLDGKFGINAKKLWNPFGVLDVCSEEIWRFLFYIATASEWDIVLDYLNKWNPNVFHSGDARNVLDFLVINNYALKMDV